MVNLRSSHSDREGVGETAAVADGREVKSSVVASQTTVHAKYGGVVPEIASRAHIENIYPVIREAIRRRIESGRMSRQQVTIRHARRYRLRVSFLQ